MLKGSQKTLLLTGLRYAERRPLTMETHIFWRRNSHAETQVGDGAGISGPSLGPVFHNPCAMDVALRTISNSSRSRVILEPKLRPAGALPED